MGTLQVINLHVYALLDPGSTLFFRTPYIVVDFAVKPKTFVEPFAVSTLVGALIISSRVYEISQSQYLRELPQSIL